MSKVKYFLQQSWLLIVASFAFGLLLAAAEAAWQPRIEANKREKINTQVRELIEGAEQSELIAENVKVTNGAGVVNSDIYQATGQDDQILGYAFTAVGSGFADKIQLIITTDDDFSNFLGYGVLSSNETPGFGDRIKNDYFRDQFEGAPAGELELTKTGNPSAIDNEIVAISGATVTSESVVEIFNTYVDDIEEELKSRGLAGDGK